MPNISKWQLEFMKGIFLLQSFDAWPIQFHVGREGSFNEQTYRNNFEKDFDYMSFNSSVVVQQSSGPSWI